MRPEVLLLDHDDGKFRHSHVLEHTNKMLALFGAAQQTGMIYLFVTRYRIPGDSKASLSLSITVSGMH